MGYDVTEVCSAHDRIFSAFFLLIIVVVQNVPLCVTDIATGCDVTESDVTGSMFCACPEVGFPPFFLVFSNIFEVFRYVV